MQSSKVVPGCAMYIASHDIYCGVVACSGDSRRTCSILTLSHELIDTQDVFMASGFGTLKDSVAVAYPMACPQGGQAMQPLHTITSDCKAL